MLASSVVPQSAPSPENGMRTPMVSVLVWPVPELADALDDDPLPHAVSTTAAVSANSATARTTHTVLRLLMITS